ncbi:hypothetical protein JY651_04395 [Pyxidicoccus parkwayensis]|uniref:4-vinyl reductase 4VR domain-containing protein n=1 Tax=Pyxidicoccus parkwayensis TaxID=2813578 RepID=A0ABX7P201_9BACT|nr:hypothetical protein [Pyxidicoccus parkwaysis]QSQ24214.1 hypothetical protein JY651_04395 [Pyxidicoccus parkwaysis]
MADTSFREYTVSGSSATAILEAVKSFSVLVNELMKVMNVQTRDANGALTLDPTAWYPVDNYLYTYKKIDMLLGARGLEKVGSFIPQNAVFPSNIQDIYSALASIDIAFHMNHRKNGQPMFNLVTGEMLEGIGHYRSEPVDGKNEIRMVCDNPYPCRFDQGLIKGMAQRFQPQATLTHDMHQGCRLKGGKSCTYVVTW